MSQGSRPRAPGFLYGTLSIVLLLIVGVVALTSQQPPPPTIAEFAPQAVEQITDAPSEQSSSIGSGVGDCPPGALDCELGQGAGGGLLASGATPAPIDVPRVRKCIGDPPRQIEDPQSPPCVPYWQGDNGGGTWRGVTRNEIRVALPLDNDQTRQNLDRRWLALEAFFNNRFEFYGRRIRLMPFRVPGVAAHDPQPDQLHSHAVHVDKEIDAFASLPYTDQGGAQVIYYDELAKRKIMSVAGEQPRETEGHFAEKAPYQWRYLTGLDKLGRNVGEWVCKQLAGRDAEHAGPQYRTTPRKFGFLVHTFADGGVPDTSGYEAALRTCGLTDLFRVEEEYASDLSQSTASSTMLSLQREGITSVICVCHGAPLWLADQPAASNQGYQPEWLISSYFSVDWDLNNRVFGRNKEQLASMFGISTWNKWLLTEDMPVHWAIREGDPGYSWNPANREADSKSWHINRYAPMLVLASAIQAAGPTLTPSNIERGLFQTRFPNPGCGGPPYWQACVGFGPGNYSMQQDAAVIWWSNTAQSNWGGAGAWCYADRGARSRIGTWETKRAAVFTGPCY